jgi:dephospho-CoA kinase
MGAKPFVVGLTGSIGCGKSTAMHTLVSLGAEGIDADKVAHAVMAPGQRAYDAILAEFGPDLIDEDGQIDRGRLGQRVFANPAELTRLEDIVHPAVGGAIQAQVSASRAPMVAIEAIKLLEAGLGRTLCDEVWVVACPPDQQFERLRSTRGMCTDEIERRRSAQMSQPDMLAQADRLIDSSGTVSGAGLQVLGAWLELGLPLPPVQVRPASPADAEGIAEVLNSVVRAGGQTMIDRTFGAEEEQSFLAELPERSRVTVALLGRVVVGFQTVEPYASRTGAMKHVASMGTYIWANVRRRGIGRALANATLSYLAGAGFRKIVVGIREDNPGAQHYYSSLGFRPCGRLTGQAFVDATYVDELLFEEFLVGRQG